MAGFEERSGLVTSKTSWGIWGQTIEGVNIEVQVDPETSSRAITCVINSKNINIAVNGNTILKGDLFGTVIKDESIWTLEDKCLIRIVLQKSKSDAANCWKALLKDEEYLMDQLTLDNMEKKLTLEKLQRENPGFDFSKADVTGNYKSGGPDLSNR